jgi:hypothetical protein
MAFHIRNCVGTRDDRSFAVQWLACAFPCRRFAGALADVCARLRADVGRYSFTVRDLHPLLLAGLPAHSEHLRGEGPLVVGFYRGRWCPFCNAELRALQAVKVELDSLKANLVVLSPETRDLPRQLKRQWNPDLTMLADVDHGVAISYGVLFLVPDETKAHDAGRGYDREHRDGSTEWMLPIPPRSFQ